MALSRYEIRNEYSLADPELYKSADKDDPEALLEGVAMAGLVGVLRQLGDLAQFAAEVFHNLHEEVMATAVRGHSLKSRIQQLEVEFPLIEKAFLSQTNHSAFFYTAGVDWHLNMHIGQNYIAKEDLPRFMMDSYEEARGPPRLFLLDKFDVVGDGACLKRFTDPSFYKVEAAAHGITNADVQRDKKVRKGKRRGSRWRNGQPQEVIPTPHAKLHQLLLEERIENRVSDPARLVKLKRKLSGFPFDLKSGQSYMKKILRDPQPDYRELHEVCYSLPLKLLDNNLMPEHGKDEFGSESPGVELTHKSPSMSQNLNNGVPNDPMMEMEFETTNESDLFESEFEKDEIGLKSPGLQLTHKNPSMNRHRDGFPNISTDKQEFEALGIENKYLPKAKDGVEVGNITSIVHEDVEKQIMVDEVRKLEGSTGYQSDDVASEVENYMDALATMESEREIDSELRTKGNLNVLSNRKRISDLDAATPLRQAHFSDSQSMGSSTLSDDGNSSSRKCKSNSSYSSSPHFLSEKSHLVDEVSDEINSFYETGETKSNSRPLKWRGRTRNALGGKVTAIPTYSSDDIEQTFSSTGVSPRVFVHRDADASVREDEVLQLKLGPLFSEGVSGVEPSNATESGSRMTLDACDSTSSATPLQTEYDSSLRVDAENHSSDNGEVKHLTEHSSSTPITSEDTCFIGRSGDQHMEEVVDKKIYLLQDVSLTSCTSDDAPSHCEENISSSPQYQPLTELANDNLKMSEQPLKPSLENELHEDLPNDESGAREVHAVFYRASIHPSSCTEDTAEEVSIQFSLQNMPQAGGTENDFEEYPVVNQSDSQIKIMPPADEQIMDPRLPELETNNRAIDTESTDDNLVKVVSPSKEVEVEERPSSPFQRDLRSKDFRISGITDMLQPLDPAGSFIGNHIEEQFSDMSDEQFPDTSFSDTEDCSDGADSNDIILDRSTMPSGEITVDMRDQALSGIPKVGDTVDIQAPVILDSIPQPNVETSDNGDEIHYELPSLAVIVEKGVSAAGETDLVTESLKNCSLNEMQAAVTTDDMLMDNAARVGTSSDQIINLHELPRLVGEELEGVSSSTDLGERSTTDCESVAENVNVSDIDVKGCRTESNQDGVDAELPSSVMYSDLGTDEKENIQKVPSQLMDYDHSESRILDKLSNSHSECSLHTDVKGSSTLEQSEFYMNGLRAEKNSVYDDTVDALPMPIYDNAEEQKVKLPLQQLDEETEVFRIPGESNMPSYITDSSVLKQSESSSKLAPSNASSMSTDRDVEEQKYKMPLHQLDEEKNQGLPIAGQSDVVLEPQLAQDTNSDILFKEGVSGVDSIYFSRNLLGQQLDSELLPREKPEIDGVGQHNKPIGSVSLTFGLLPEAVNTGPVEMPPLPPLPPVQWRMGKNQQAGLAHEQAVLPNNNILLPSTSLSVADHRTETPTLIPPSHADAAENSILTYESTSDTLHQDCRSSLKFPLSVNITHLQALGETQPVEQNIPFPGSNSNLLSFGGSQSLHNNLLLPEHEADLAVTEFHSSDQNLLLPVNNKFPSLSETQSLYQNLPLPAKLDEISQHDDHTGTSLNPSSSGTDGDASSACDVELSVDSETISRFNKKPQETSQNKILDQGSAISQRNASNDASALPPKIENEQSHNMISCLEGDVRWPAQDEFKRSGVRPMKLPRQRNPLIDAVIALDKSKLRKVTEQPKTQMQKADDRYSVLENLQLRKVTEQPRAEIQKVDESDSVLENLQLRKLKEQPNTPVQKADERDTLLQQIRAKSFNLKPTVVSRPGVKGPTTNLKVAAIIEKAKTIRQAFAGSDEDDDDDDSWSDS